jgi:hypothetical protein
MTTITIQPGSNFKLSGFFAGRCSSCFEKKQIVYVFKLKSGKVLTQECEDCMIEHN